VGVAVEAGSASIRYSSLKRSSRCADNTKDSSNETAGRSGTGPGARQVAVVSPFEIRRWQPVARGFQQGLREAGFAEGGNVASVYRWTDGKKDLLPELAADLVRSGVALIVASADTPTALAALAAAPHIPVVFLTQEDPVRFGLVASLDRPAGRATGLYLTRPRSDDSFVSAHSELQRLLVPNSQGVTIFEIFDTSSVAMKPIRRQPSLPTSTLRATATSASLCPRYA
jgi:ABC-type uncharacterized transport system substrate-binding protein